MRNSTIRSFIIAAIGFGASAHALGADEPGKRCSDAMLKGSYGIQMQGTRILPGGVTESGIGVVIRHYDGQGGVTQVDNIKWSITGWVPDRPGEGKYHVNDDCSVVIDFEPVPGFLIQERAVLVDSSHEVRSITVLPPTIMVTSVQIRI